MTAPAVLTAIEDVCPRLEDLVHRDALGELLGSALSLFGVPVRLYGQDGRLLAGAADESELYATLGEHRRVGERIRQIVADVKQLDPDPRADARRECVTGAVYRVVRLEYDGHPMGRLIFGPYASPEVDGPSEQLFELAPELDRARIAELYEKLPRVADEVVLSVARHLSRTFELILFSEHRALLTSNMHLASVRESFRELEEKTRKLEEANARLTELDRLKSNFLATVSHELRTPLTSIIGYSEMLVEGLAGDLTGEQREFVSTIREKGDQLLALIKGLLDLSKLESGMASLARDYIQADRVVEDVLATVQPHARKRQVAVVERIEAGLPRVHADAGRLRQLLLNLVDNAIKFTNPGGCVSIEVRLTSMDPEKMHGSQGVVLLGSRRAAIEFRVADDGIGIPAAERDKVFEPFYQVDSSSTREQGGTGLGLSIVKRLVEAHGGRVSIEDNVPRGTVFVVLLPLRFSSLG
ncbi:MAG TPA: ATP-binding protein [Polyangiaceae bacterium]|nr:ATP-binding protein [Polyangiaceae bacterium]